MDSPNHISRLFLILLCCFSYLLSTNLAAKTSWRTYLKPSLEAGVMAGYTGGYRRGRIVNPATGDSSVNSGSQDSGEIGAQMRLLFGSEYNYRPFIYLNGAKGLGTPISILLGNDFPPFTTTTKLTLMTNWLARLGIGGASPWYFNTFQLHAGLAAALLNQTLQTYAGPSIFSQNQTALRPSLMAGVTWCLCKKCVIGHRALLTAQITADRNPYISDSIPSSLGTLDSRINQLWVARGDLILSIKLW